MGHKDAGQRLPAAQSSNSNIGDVVAGVQIDAGEAGAAAANGFYTPVSDGLVVAR